MFTFIDLFCGIGSFHYSFQKLGWKCVMASDIDEDVRKTYFENYGMMPLSDITKIDPATVKPYDILCAGFPCQPFSQCGFQKGFSDDRGNLFFSIMKFVRFHSPKIIILENVSGLLTHDNGNTFKRIINEITEAKYNVQFKILTCSDYGIPQMRKRLFIIGLSRELPLVNILDLNKYKKNTTLSDFLEMPFEKECAYTIRCGGRNSPINDRHNWDGYIVNGEEYRLTIPDCLKLQGFTNFKMTGNSKNQWKQLGNTIPTIFTEIIGKSILTQFGN